MKTVATVLLAVVVGILSFFLSLIFLLIFAVPFLVWIFVVCVRGSPDERRRAEWRREQQEKEGWTKEDIVPDDRGVETQMAEDEYLVRSGQVELLITAYRHGLLPNISLSSERVYEHIEAYAAARRWYLQIHPDLKETIPDFEEELFSIAAGTK